jgi:predicted Zn finger-like uncharacterized protein
MFTLCPTCESVHAVDAGPLSAARGLLRCARCETTFQALDALYDDYPDRRKPTADHEADAPPPEVGRKPAPAFPAAPDEPPVPPPAPRHWPWAIALVVLFLATLVNVSWTLRSAISQDSAIAQTLQRLSVPGFEPAPPYRDPSRIHLLARDMHDHPTRPGVLVLSATFVNLASQSQPYPDVAVALRDSENQTVAARRFDPADYLLQPPGEGAQLASGQQVPILLEFADPGQRATGFEITFH